MKSIAIGVAAFTAIASSSAYAQQAQQPAGLTNPGPVIAGVCVFYNDRMLAQSTVGQAVNNRMQQLAQEVQAELAPYATTIQNEAQQLQAAGASLPADQANQRRQQLQQRVNEAQQLEQTRENELRYTLAEQRRLISNAVEPILIQVYQERGCGILLDRESVFVLNPAMEVTDLVIQRLNTALPTLSFNRLQVPAQAQQQ
ncbi:OmpH family outer membrane protein [Brevundimonas sp. S30B]|uniref:OmpH family outer membrane protein n=1 Tax=unclassified Brevundimonas TaxID=2622653 RepID=UPI0010717DDD|nr:MULTISPECIES: OmpH family outer membrane protein [unclassified Brevundimonas]QBX37943.1 OmpH family outer membrane protein [Brevundimonas sp. MF30-B]TFW02702.1 OmpH family outer membrane protein [Brevundimonas sp. S30B]